MRRIRNRLLFTMRMHDGSVVEIGFLRWPYRVRYARIVNGIAEVFDSKGAATFSIDDIYLSDLEVS